MYSQCEERYFTAQEMRIKKKLQKAFVLSYKLHNKSKSDYHKTLKERIENAAQLVGLERHK